MLAFCSAFVGGGFVALKGSAEQARRDGKRLRDRKKLNRDLKNFSRIKQNKVAPKKKAALDCWGTRCCSSAGGAASPPPIRGCCWGWKPKEREGDWGKAPPLPDAVGAYLPPSFPFLPSFLASKNSLYQILFFNDKASIFLPS